MGALETTTPLWGHWTPGPLLGSGPHGSVYQVTHSVFGDGLRRAVRHIPIAGASALERWTEDLALCARLRGVDSLLNYDEHLVLPADNGSGYDLFLRMELAQSLAAQLPTTVLPESEIVQLGQDIADALGVLEANGLPHRNVKPSNLFRAADGHWQLGDLLITRRLDRRTEPGAFTAPEVAAGVAGSPASDVFSLGLLLYTLCNDNQIPSDPPKLPPAGASPALARVILRACASEPRNRYPTAALLADALRALQPAEAPPVPASLPELADESDEMFDAVVPDETESLWEEAATPEPPAAEEPPDEIAEFLEPLLPPEPAPSAPVAMMAEPAATEPITRRRFSKALAAVLGLCVVAALAVVAIFLLRGDRTQPTLSLDNVTAPPTLAEPEPVSEPEPAVAPEPAPEPEPAPAPEPAPEPEPEPEPEPAPEPQPLEPVVERPAFLFPDSSEVHLTEADLEGLTWAQCGVAKNEIYARHGRIFTNPGLASYFQSQDWYKGTVAPEIFHVNDYFNDCEMYNADFITDYEIRTFGSACQDFSSVLPPA